VTQTDKGVELVPYDKRWPELFEAERAELMTLRAHGIKDIQHVGSTAIPGLAAKPIVDVMVGVEPLLVGQGLLDALKRLGYEYFGEYGIPGRHFFRKGDPRTHHLHWVGWGGDFWVRQVDFRDYLRAFPEEAERYERLKRDLAARFSSDRDSYTKAKTHFVEDILLKAAWWKTRKGTA
jgi:GrpB-like predicted nucleotidyltransferase (UPF0157 family)